MSKGIYAGKTWIVAIIAMVVLMIIALGTTTGLTIIMLRASNETIKIVSGLSIASVPYAVVKGIERIFKRLLPKQ